MPTRISYRYADKNYCKQYTSIVVEGTITWEQIEPYLAARRSFIPGQLGLEDLQYRFALPGADHPWHQIAPGDLKPTDAAPTIALTAAELAERFANTTWIVDWMQREMPTKSPAVQAPVQAPEVEASSQRDASTARSLWRRPNRAK